jgi:hypothetical protein
MSEVEPGDTPTTQHVAQRVDVEAEGLADVDERERPLEISGPEPELQILLDTLRTLDALARRREGPAIVVERLAEDGEHQALARCAGTRRCHLNG